MSAAYLLEDLAPWQMLRRFEDICRIPHGSGNEAALGAYIREAAEENQLRSEQDEAGNILVWVPASPGYEDAAPLLLQGHIDMVCAQEPEASIDMQREPVRLVREGNILRADGTTLGADNAVGVSAMLAVMSERTLLHPPLELLFTTGEEVGLVGVKRFDTSRLRARRMINMDCGDPDMLTIGSAGSAKFAIERDCDVDVFDGCALIVTIDGLLGGHSGVEAGKNRASAVDLAGRLLYALSEERHARLIDLESDAAATSIPRRASLTVGFDTADKARALETIGRMDAAFRTETASADPGYRLMVSEARADRAVTAEDTRALAGLMLLIPYDVSRRSNRDPSWPLCSALMTGARQAGGLFTATFSVRANLDAYGEAGMARMRALVGLTGARAALLSAAPAWPEAETSPMRELCLAIYRDMFGAPMGLELVHGTLEVGVIKKALPDMDIVGFAPKSRGAHTTEERLYLDTVEPFWNYLSAVLAALKD